MVLYLSKQEQLDILKKQKLIINKDIIVSYLNKIQENTLNYINNLQLLILDKSIINNEKCMNLPVWQLGHIIDFYMKHTLNLLKTKSNISFNILSNYIKQIEQQHNINFKVFFDSFQTSQEIRSSKKICYKRLQIVYKSIIKILISYVKTRKLDVIDNYLIMLSILHNDMHNENFIFTLYYLQNSLLKEHLISNIIISNEKKIENPYINIHKGFLHQGSNISEHRIVFDNETPVFLTKIEAFCVNKYTITEYEFLEFVNNYGYSNNDYWCQNGLYWKNKHNIKHPLYWFNINNIWYRKHYDTIHKVGSNIPICNISWYEAQAYCKWKNVRLLTETEWEYLATNLGRNLYPWGDNPVNSKLCNINNINDYCINVDSFKSGENIKGISQLIGNVWEWCEEPIYPYKNFVIDPIYREMSYPYFGEKKICRGGCFCIQDYLISSSYRNAQLPDCRIQFIGFRTCLKST